jgi:hypothetical protein
MKTAEALRAEAQHLRVLVRHISDPKALAELHTMIQELEERARALGNGDAQCTVTADIGWLLPSAFDAVQPHLR